MADGPRRVPFHSLEIMTDNFSPHLVIGHGSYGKVYLGTRPEDGQKIAVKILHDMPGHGDEQFENEFYNLANLKHRNIVRLVGFCNETRQEIWPYNGAMVLANVTKRALCFEFMENESLSDRLLDESTGQGWHTRYAMIKGICNGLKYLHEEVEPPIFHLDLKPANILLDQNMIPKIADFGLSRFFKEEKSYSSNSPIGTRGYLPPEFINKNIISNKFDIFSLGVVVIKIIAGPEGYSRSAETTSDQFTKTVHDNWRVRLQSTGSGDLLESYSEQVKTCIGIALSCLKADRQERPTIGYIVNKLTGTETPENYHEALIDEVRPTIALSCLEDDRQKRPTIGDIVNKLTGTLENYDEAKWQKRLLIDNKFTGRETIKNYLAALIDEMSTNLIDVHPLQLHFSFRPNKCISCVFHVTNNMNDQHLSVRCVPKHEEATPRYYACRSRIACVVPPRSTHTFVVTMVQQEQPPAIMDVLDMVVETILGEVKLRSLSDSFDKHFEDAREEKSCGFREVTLKAVCATTSKTTTSEVLMGDDRLWSMDAHPTEPWILAGYARRLVIWNYKTQTRMMECGFFPGRADASYSVVGNTVRFIVKSKEQLFVVGDDYGYIYVHDSMTMKELKKFKAHGSSVTSFAVHPTQPFVLSASWDKLIKLWDYDKGWECIQTFTGHSHWVWQVKFNPHDANTFASASGDGTVKIWSISSPMHVTSLDCEGGQGCVDYYPTAAGGDQQHYMLTGSIYSGKTSGIFERKLKEARSRAREKAHWDVLEIKRTVMPTKKIDWVVLKGLIIAKDNMACPDNIFWDLGFFLEVDGHPKS
ncbi:cysteine-rich receptor-like protein kinase 26 [Hordeum vulgare]|nr:cysteine-rich receptor-like protein kinase 26 [Hordeum vulgare]